MNSFLTFNAVLLSDIIDVSVSAFIDIQVKNDRVCDQKHLNADI